MREIHENWDFKEIERQQNNCFSGGTKFECLIVSIDYRIVLDQEDFRLKTKKSSKRPSKATYASKVTRLAQKK